MRAVVYACAASAGLAVAANPPVSLTTELGVIWSHAVGALAFVAGCTALAASLAYRWMVEWLAVVQTGGAFAVYTILQWLLAAGTGDPGYLAAAFLLTAMTAALIGRAVELWAFSMRVRLARESRQAVA